jgi:hypothetical protein
MYFLFIQLNFVSGKVLCRKKDSNTKIYWHYISSFFLDQATLVEQVKRIKEIEAIESDSFVQQTFRSSKEVKKVNFHIGIMNTSLDSNWTDALLMDFTWCKYFFSWVDEVGRESVRHVTKKEWIRISSS